MTLKDKLKEFDEKFDSRYAPPDYRGLGMKDETYDFNCKFHDDQKKVIKNFIKSTIQETLESLQGEKQINGIEWFKAGWNAREKKLREDINKFLTN